MVAKKILFLSAGATLTANEITALNKLNALAGEPYQVLVRNGAVPAEQLYGAGPEDCDYVAFVSPMTKPAAYSAKTTFNPDAPLNGGNLLATQAIVSNAQALAVPVTGTYSTTATLTVAGGVVTAIALS